MKLVVAEAGRVSIAEVPTPTCGKNEVLVRTAYSVVSTGTEMWTLDSTKPISAAEIIRSSRVWKSYKLTREVAKSEGLRGLFDYVNAVRKPRVPLGYSLSGTVVEVGKNIIDINVGDRVACAGEEKASHAEYASVPRKLFAKVPDGVELQDSSFATIGAIALHGFRRSGAQIGDAMVVIGAGLVGNLMVQVCKAAGCRVVAIDFKEERLSLARELGADLILKPNNEKLEQHVQQFTGGLGADGVIICAATSSSDPVNLAGKIARDRATITVVGRVGMKFDRKPYYQKELNIVMSRSLGPGRYDSTYEEDGTDYPIGYVRWTLNRNMIEFLNLLGEGRVRVRGLVGGTYPIEQAAQAYVALRTQIKPAVMLEYRGDSAQPSVISGTSTYPRKAGRIEVALVGPGNYAKEILIPLLRKNKNYNLRWVVASNPLHSKQVADRYRFELCTTNFEEVIKDPEVDLVAIATPNNLHYPMVIESIRAGKDVFVEKPLCIKEEQLDEIIRLQSEAGTRVIVGFNRRYSPLVLRVREELRELKGPFLLTYRVNADYAPATRWMQDPGIGGGKIIHEGCHFFDLFNFLLKSDNPEISISCLDVTGSTTVARDNIVVTLKYPNGSVATLVYAALGNRNAPRERLEIFAQQTVLELNDFKTLKIYEATKTREYSQDEKGHRSEMEEVAKFIHGDDSSLITFDEAVAAMRLTFAVEREARRLPTQNGSN